MNKLLSSLIIVLYETIFYDPYISKIKTNNTFFLVIVLVMAFEKRVFKKLLHYFLWEGGRTLIIRHWGNESLISSNSNENI